MRRESSPFWFPGAILNEVFLHLIILQPRHMPRREMPHGRAGRNHRYHWVPLLVFMDVNPHAAGVMTYPGPHKLMAAMQGLEPGSELPTLGFI